MQWLGVQLRLTKERMHQYLIQENSHKSALARRTAEAGNLFQTSKGVHQQGYAWEEWHLFSKHQARRRHRSRRKAGTRFWRSVMSEMGVL
eukprot:1157707-Pelagomonas_calceolata.AAC.3